MWGLAIPPGTQYVVDNLTKALKGCPVALSTKPGGWAASVDLAKSRTAGSAER